MNDTDAALSREATEALNASMPDIVKAAGRAPLASRTILIAAFAMPAIGLLAVIFASALASTPALFAGVIAAIALLIGIQIAGGVIGLRAKRAFKRIAETVEREHQAILISVVNRELHVRR